MANGRLGTEIVGPNGEHFRIEEFRGGGSFGAVYKAAGLKSQTVVAVKMVPPQKLNDPSTLAFRTILNETRTEMLKISHPNIVRVLYVDSGSDPNVGPYVIMEFVAGGNLQDLLDRRFAQPERFTLDEAFSLMRGITLGAQAINEHMIHRDIKPDNILLDGPPDAPCPKIADFGIARISSEYTRAETFKGIQMLWYKAPEVWRQEKNTFKIDVYSVGLVFYQILTLEHPLMQHASQPFDWDRWREIHLTIQCPSVRDIRPDVPIHLAKLLLRMVDKSPGNRPDWDEVINGLNSAAAPQTTVEVDPQLLAAFKQQAHERLHEEQVQTTAELTRQRDAERAKARSDEYAQSALRLLTRFDQTIEALNSQETSYPMQVDGSSAFSRTYSLPNERQLACRIFAAPHSSKTGENRILGAGYLGIEGGLSANLVLFGQPDDISTARWSTVEANVFALIAGPERLKWYRVAGLTDETVRFVEFFDGGEPWRRDSPSYFGFSEAGAFYEHYERGARAMHVFSFNIRADILSTFNEILLLGLRMPRK